MQDDQDLLEDRDLEVWEAKPPPRDQTRGLMLPLLIALSGVMLLALLALLDAQAQEPQVWGNALLYAGPLPIPEDEQIIPVLMRQMPEPRSPLLDGFEETSQGREAVQKLQLDKGEWVVLLPVSDDVLKTLLADGRIPARGRFEALAGDLARGASFEIDGHEFKVVGRLQRGVGGLGFAFVVPDDETYRPLFTPDLGATTGWLDLIGRERLATMPAEQREQFPETVGPSARAGKGVAAGVVLGLVLVALGGSVTYYRIFMRMAARGVGGAQGMLEDVRDRPGLFWGMHVLLYGVLFLMMLLAVKYPVAAMRIEHYVGEELSKGSLRHIGEAYASRDVVLAAVMTFAHNYFLATLLYTFVLSLVIPFGGVLKNLLTFMVVGFAMSPLWLGSAWGMSFHSITMAVELGAYIVASFAVAVLWIRVVQGLSRGQFWSQLVRGLQTVWGAALISGAMLAVAALYEAASLILLT
ncbi:MAG: hypothetical protein NTZ09_16690 [Candidatus Hydrogenedentes bacterium]|nr:hypothetical protein [Candidatus Hydrogenedentota bacterium]